MVDQLFRELHEALGALQLSMDLEHRNSRASRTERYALIARQPGSVRTGDGERLEGVGVTPTIEVPFDVAYSAGADPQLARAVEVLSAAVVR